MGWMGRVGTLNAPLSAVLIKPSTCAMCILTESDYPRNHFTMCGCPISYSWLSTTRSKLPWSSDPFHSSGLDTGGLDHRGIGFPAASLSVPIEVTWHPLMASPFNPVGCTGWQTGADSQKGYSWKTDKLTTVVWSPRDVWQTNVCVL